MSRYQVLIDDEAARNIDSIYQWLAARSAEGAVRWYLALLDALGKLATDAERFPVAPDCGQFQERIQHLILRMKSGRRYRVLFTIVASDVHVLFVRGPGQDTLDH